MHLLDAVKMIVENSDMEFKVKDHEGKTVGILYWEEFNDNITINKKGRLSSIGPTLKDLRTYNGYVCTLITK